jgi:hypothetical protein
MGDDTFCLFIIVVGLTASSMPGVGDIIIGLFGLAIALAALRFPATPEECRVVASNRHYPTGF